MNFPEEYPCLMLNGLHDIMSERDLDEMIAHAKELTLEELKGIYSDVAFAVEKIQARLNDNSYAQSIKIYVDEYNRIILKGDDDRKNKLSNYALIEENNVYCCAGNANGDGHVNEFLNSTDGFIPNFKYHVENATYIIDGLGRVCDTYEHHVTERMTNRFDRSKVETEKLKNYREGDVGGHIVAYSIDGVSESINIVPMSSRFNQSGDWKSMEGIIEGAYKNHIPVSVHKHFVYLGDSFRPSNIEVSIALKERLIQFQCP